MSDFAHDNFESYPVGASLGSFGGYIKRGFGFGSIVSGGWNGSARALTLDDGVGISAIMAPVKSVSLGAYFLAGPGFTRQGAHIFQAINQDSLLGDIIIGDITIEQNGTISAYSSTGTLLCNTGKPGTGTGSDYVPSGKPPFFLFQDEWVYLIITLSFDSWLDVGIPRLTNDFQITVNNVLICRGDEKTHLAIAALPYPLPNVNQWNVQGVGGGGNKLDNIFVTDEPNFGEPYFPPAKIPVRMTQGVVEFGMIDFPTRMNRVTQLVTEYRLVPTTKYIRATQLVVEVMGKGRAILGDGMKVREI